jgi:hypothetical protein
LKLPKTFLLTLESGAAKAGAASKAIAAYLSKACGVKV